MRAFLLCLLLRFAPLLAQAGPWPREAQAWFVSTSAGLERSGSGWRRFGDVHAEYGVFARLTLATQLRHAGSSWRGGARLGQAGARSALPLLLHRRARGDTVARN